MFSTKDKVGSLHDVLGVFRKNRINLSMIESRPSRKKAWDYYFFTDCEGHMTDSHIISAINELEKKCDFVKILGSYPRSIEE
jgi:chorismate mutase/prephenate dehydratase